MLLELPAPGVQDTRQTRQISADAACIVGETFQRCCRGFAQGLIGRSRMGTTEGTSRLRHGEGEEEIRPWELLLQLVVEPLLRLIVLTLWAMAIAAGV